MFSLQQQLQELLKSEPNLVAGVLFGSQAKGSAHEESDIDVALLYPHRSVPNTLHILELKETLEEKMKKSIDLVCLNTASPIIGMQIYEYGKLFLINDQKSYDLYLMRLFSEYYDLKMLRKPLEKSLLKRKYYG